MISTKTITRRKVIIIAIVVIISFVVLKLVVSMFDALRYSELTAEFRAKDSVWLLAKMNDFSSYKASLAEDILVERKDKRIFSYLITKVNKEKGITQAGYIQSLARMEDSRAIPVVQKILHAQTRPEAANEVYWQSIIALATLKDETVWPIVIKLAESDNAGDMALAVDALGAFAKKECLPYLLKIKERKEKKDYKPFIERKDGVDTEVAVLWKDNIDEAIKKIDAAGELVEK